MAHRGSARFSATIRRSALAALLVCGSTAFAQDYPSKPVRMIVPFPPGGGSDLIVRVAAQKLTGFLGQPTVIDNRAGASGNIAADAVLLDILLDWVPGARVRNRILAGNAAKLYGFT